MKRSIVFFYKIFLSIFLMNVSIAKKNLELSQASMLLNLNDNKVLYADNINKRIKPASLVKLMTLYIVFEALENKKISIRKKFFVSSNLNQVPRSKIYLKHGDRIILKDIIYSLIVCSANDSALVFAENFAGSEASFVKIMNAKAKALKMYDTNFCNASGLNHDKQFSTVNDLVKLSLAIRKFKKYYRIFKEVKFKFKGKTYSTTNRFLKSYFGVEGLKTGFTKASGFNLVIIAKRKGVTLLGIVIGQDSDESRTQKMKFLLDLGFSNLKLKLKKDIY